MQRLGDEDSVKLPVRVPREWMDRLKRIAEDDGTTVSVLIRGAIQRVAFMPSAKELGVERPKEKNAAKRYDRETEIVNHPNVQAEIGSPLYDRPAPVRVDHHPTCKCLRCRPKEKA